MRRIVCLLDGDPTDPLDSVARADMALAIRLREQVFPNADWYERTRLALVPTSELTVDAGDLVLAGGSLAGSMAASQGRGQLVLLVHTPGSPAKYTDPEVARSYGTDLGPLPPAALEKRRRVLRALEAADLVCANSSWTASVYRRTYGPWLKDFPPVCSESVGVDIDVERASPLRGEFVLLSIVRAKPRKRCEGLWSAASALRARGVPYLWRVLCGRHRDEVEADAAHAGATGFRFHGCLSDSEVDAHLRTAHLFVHPAHAEHLGLGILEALVRGVPVVASRSGGPPTYLRDGVEATFFQPDDWGDLAARICEALGAPERGEAGRQLVRQRFSWCSVVQRVKRALEKSP